MPKILQKVALYAIPASALVLAAHAGAVDVTFSSTDAGTIWNSVFTDIKTFVTTYWPIALTAGAVLAMLGGIYHFIVARVRRPGR